MRAAARGRTMAIPREGPRGADRPAAGTLSGMAWIARAWILLLVILIPVVRPALPGNTALVDYLNLVACPVLLAWVLFRGGFRLRLAVPAGVILIGSLIAMLNSRALTTNLLALSQEVYLFALFVTLDHVLRRETDLKFFVVTWMATAAAESLVIFSDLAADMDTRARGTFENPNMASSYLGLSVFLAFHPALKGRHLLRVVYVTLVGVGMLGTKSLSGILALSVGIILLVIGYQVRVNRRRLMKPVVAGSLLLVLGAVVLPQILSVKNTLDRLPRSSSGRLATWQIGLETFVENPLGIGIGPGAFVKIGVVTGGEWGVGRHKSLHSDYLSFLVERGIVGFAGLVLLIAAIARFLVAGFRRAASRETLLWMFALSGMYAFILVDAFSHEVLHYRHVLCTVALIACQSRIRIPASAPISAKRPTDAPFEG